MCLLLLALVSAHAETPVPAAPVAPVPVAPVATPAPVAAVPVAAPVAAAPVAPVAAPVATPAAPAQYECTSFPVRSTMAMGAFQAPADVTNAKLNPTRLPPGWVPMAGSVGEGGAFVIACRPLGG